MRSLMIVALLAATGYADKHSTMPYSVYFIPVATWSDGTPAPMLMARH